jgi:hypothetical protein
VTYLTTLISSTTHLITALWQHGNIYKYYQQCFTNYIIVLNIWCHNSKRSSNCISH